MNFLSSFNHPPARPVQHRDSHLDLDAPLLHFSPRDTWRIRDSFEGTSILGATGSGKTSGSGGTLARAFLAHGYGGLVLTAKPGERQLWEHYARQTGRSDSLLVISPTEPWRCNFVEYEARRPGRGGGLTENLTRLFGEALEIAERRSAEQEDFWSRAARQLLRNAIDLLLLSNRRVTLPGIYEVIVSAPTEAEQLGSREFQGRSECLRCLLHGAGLSRTPEQQQNWKITSNFWQNEFLHLSPRTRSCIVATVTSLVDPLMRGVVHTLFATSTNVVPEVAHEGAVIILDLPVLEFGNVGQLCQVLFKFLFQKSSERRDLSRGARPVFIWADEFQYFSTSHDSLFQSTARSAHTATVYLTQSLPGYLASVGGSGKGQAFVDALMGNLTTKLFHANTCSKTNHWAAETIARNWQARGNMGASTSDYDQGGSRSSRSIGSTDALDFQVEPHEFTLLRKGGPENGGRVDAILFQGGRTFHESKKNHLKVTFAQS